ncbi:hypothetical protein ASPFODRAFT_445804 [Aspergillus luchuensis CBS 106.47]|uniref:Zn(2)-C6 fungal-type domain-containing protein n=1 Tax=Aspergillus luchuensis (strain CBS 106.47) TaxID=1137211 RepID=A0A1M3TX16_ASPLC|nr:hypothetical protein ASPFODRAFT_445804 [Aspergillus luchuensis CBS 106.47]
MTLRAKPKLPPCKNCRRQHKQCDRNQPSCLRCQRTGQVCIRDRYRVRFCYNSQEKYSLDFPIDQKWLSATQAGMIHGSFPTFILNG